MLRSKEQRVLQEFVTSLCYSRSVMGEYFCLKMRINFRLNCVQIWVVSEQSSLAPVLISLAMSSLSH